MNKLDKSMIVKSFDLAAAHYEKYAVLQRSVSERLLERLDLIRIRPRWIVDMGSGTGMTARSLEKKYKSARVVQIDLSGRMLRYSRRQKRLFSRQHYIRADMEKVPLADNSVDLVCSSLTYQWCNSLDRVYSESCRLLTPDSPLIFAMPGPDTLKELRASWAAVDDKVHVNDFIDMHDAGDALTRAGFQGIVMDVETITMEYPDCIQLMRELKHIGAHNVDVTRRKSLTGKNSLQRMLSAYEQFRCKGVLPATYEIVYGLAWKPAADHSLRERGIAYVPVEKIKRTKR